jgi:hypothetical protein
MGWEMREKLTEASSVLIYLKMLIAKNSNNNLFINALSKGIGKMSEAFCAVCAEAACVCFQAQGHECGVVMTIGGTYTNDFEIHWTDVNEEARVTWSDPQVATEFGAYGIAFLLIRTLTEFTVIERSVKGTGFDYWLGCKDDNFQKKARLEVSGIRQGTEGDVNYRVKEKLEQVTPTDQMGFPAYVVVIEFNRPISKVVKK